ASWKWRPGDEPAGPIEARWRFHPILTEARPESFTLDPRREARLSSGHASPARRRWAHRVERSPHAAPRATAPFRAAPPAPRPSGRPSLGGPPRAGRHGARPADRGLPRETRGDEERAGAADARHGGVRGRALRRAELRVGDAPFPRGGATTRTCH